MPGRGSAGVGADLGGLERDPHRGPGAEAEGGDRARSSRPRGRAGSASTATRTVSPWASRASTRPGQALRGEPSGRCRCRATADGGNATNTGPAPSATRSRPPPSRSTDRAARVVRPRVAPVEVEADEPGDVRRAGAAGELGRGAGLHDPPGLEHDDPVGEDHGVERVVGDEDGRPGELPQVPGEVGAHVQPRAGVERGERLVEQEQVGVGDERPGEGGALGLPARQPARDGRRPARRGPPGPATPAPPGGRPGGACRGPAARRRRCRGRTGGGTAGSPGRRHPPGGAGRRRTGRRAGSSSRRSPSRTWPSVSGTRPASAASAVDFPAPLGPSSATTSPPSTRRGRSSANAPRSHLQVGVETGHDAGPPTQRSRRLARTRTDTTSSSRDRTTAASGSVSRAR